MTARRVLLALGWLAFVGFLLVVAPKFLGFLVVILGFGALVYWTVIERARL